MRNAFTLLELVIVIVIIGVLAALALPHYLYVIEEAKASEAINAIGAIRLGMERCYLMNHDSYDGCDAGFGGGGGADGWGKLEMDDPGKSPGAHFEYFTNSGSADSYLICALKVNGTAVGYCYYMCMGLGVKPVASSFGSGGCGASFNWLHDNKIYWGSDPQISALLPKSY